ncbi:DUF2793 domain-containing protein [Aurantiacibacter sp. D1-12]|uniref:DUF2793 domain-containing protein n=1 Tax=Aurantiacibacter sp. D1-12 TaxID=2993658 RepID=UPI00237C5AF2|nr:DUF2793 domain-containing protein [Aurantiacibacter sp. D1-12]MDE1468574.1 DUF2793 domain-containing protein [Aurantiacibacter sp. D1-12]
MTDPVSFTAATPRYVLPNLFTAQAQKEFTINEAHARLDILLHPAVEGEANVPPVTPPDGATWIVGSTPSGDWADNAGDLASWQAGNWVFVSPQPGMQVFDQAARVTARFDGVWQYAATVSAPSGGTTEDTEARAAITGLIAALVSAGILPAV